MSSVSNHLTLTTAMVEESVVVENAPIVSEESSIRHLRAHFGTISFP
jgi:hypothetical protein